MGSGGESIRWDRAAWLWRAQCDVGEVTAPTWSECRAQLDAIASVPDPVQVITAPVCNTFTLVTNECPRP